MKFETVGLFYVFGLFSSINFATMATWLDIDHYFYNNG